MLRLITDPLNGRISLSVDAVMVRLALPIQQTVWGKRLVRHRTTLGMTQRTAADRLGVDQGTLANWEQRKREPAGRFLARVKRYREFAANVRDFG